MSSSLLWSQDAANKTLFTYDGHGTCKFVYDVEQRYLKIVNSSEDSDVIDIIDIIDMIGANIEIESLNTEHAVAVTAATSGGLVSNNEPMNNNLQDTTSRTILHLYVYPRQEPRTLYERLCGSSDKPKPNPQYVRKVFDEPNHSRSQPPRFAFHRHLILHATEDLHNARTVLHALKKLANPNYTENQHYLILVNPQSGPKRNGEQLANDIVIPMLTEQAGIETTLKVTTHAKHASEWIIDDHHHISNKYNGLVLIGGDGIVHEIINGIYNSDSSEAERKQRIEQLPLGIIGCGTANGLATALTHASKEPYGVLQETFLIAKGHTVAADISKYQVVTVASTTDNSDEDNNNNNNNNNNSMIKTYYSHLTFSYGFIADVDIGSECIRWLGESRFDVYAIWRVLRLRKYRAKISYSTSIDQKLAPNDPVPSNWVSIEDDIVLFWATQVTHAGMSTFISPQSHFQDGVFKILLIRGNVSRYRILRILLALETGSHIDLPGLEWITCSQYRLEPILSDTTTKTYNDIDGEPVEDGPIQGYVMPKGIRFFAKTHQRGVSSSL